MPGPVFNWYQPWTLAVLLLWHSCGKCPTVSLPISHAIIPQAFLQDRARAERGAGQQHYHHAVSVSFCDCRSLEWGQEAICAKSAAAAMSLPTFLKKFIEKKDRRFGTWWSRRGDNKPDASEGSFTVRDVTVNNSSLLPKEVLVEASITSG